MEEYSDGVDRNNNNPLRYEHTLNRDITRTIERINRSLVFRDSVVDVIDILSTIMKKDVDKIFRETWRSEHESHTNPKGLSIAVDIVPPVLKKVHAEGDTDKYFKMHKEYPFYYLMNLKASFKFIPNEDDKMKDDEAWYGKWFMEKIAPSMSKKILIKSRDELLKKFSNVFSFPLLDAIDKKNSDSKEYNENSNEQNAQNNDNSTELVQTTKTIEESIQHTLKRINVVFTPTLKFASNDSSGIMSRFDSTSDMKNVLVFSTAMAFERIFNG